MISEITASKLTTEVTVRAGGRVRTFYVHPPAAGQAIAIIEAAQTAEGAEGEDERAAAVAYIFSEARQWMPLTLASLITSKGFPQDRAIRTVLSLLTAGAPAPRKAAKMQEEAEAKARRVGWTEIVAEYMHAYGQSLDEALRTPFPAFLALTSRIERIRAAEMLRELHVRGIPHIKSDHERRQALARIQASAGAGRQSPSVPEDKVPDWVKDPEKRRRWKEKQDEELRRVMAVWSRKKAEA